MATQPAIVIACDLEGYSKLSVRKQLRAFQGLQDVVRAALSLAPKAHPPLHQPVIPTGDGVIVCLLQAAGADDDDDDRLQLALKLSAAFLAWAAASADLLDGRGLSVGIHDGRVQAVTDINGNRNVCGAAINMAARVQAGAAPWTVLINQACWDEFVGRGQAVTVTAGATVYSVASAESLTVKAKHDVEIRAYRLVATPDLASWPAAPPVTPVRRVYLAFPRSYHPTAAPLLQAARDALSKLGITVLDPPEQFQERTIRPRLREADAVIAFVIRYAQGTHDSELYPTSAWVMNTIGAARGGLLRPKPVLVLCQKGVENFGWGNIAELGPGVKFDGGLERDLVAIAERVNSFVDLVNAGELGGGE